MSGKKIAIGTKPTAKPAPAPVDDWVESRAGEASQVEPKEPVKPKEPEEPMKRLTIDIPESLHRAIKSQCAMRGSKIADEVRELLLQKYGKS